MDPRQPRNRQVGQRAPGLRIPATVNFPGECRPISRWPGSRHLERDYDTRRVTRAQTQYQQGSVLSGTDELDAVFPAASRAITLTLKAVPHNAFWIAPNGAIDVCTKLPLAKTSYPTTPTLSVEGFHANQIAVWPPRPHFVRAVGAVGGVVSASAMAKLTDVVVDPAALLA